ncbi:EamA family transporter RarD [Gudongella sp. DL1XJH-153]|uniref:EamA family transporter RarD n=1 Tax=Gudongella sp. DL1XJH-153 TaxID=3409804 RepID=UPI003BB6741C
MKINEYTQGLVLGILSFVLWGFLPLYWKIVEAVNPFQIFAHRIFWSFLFVILIIILKKKGQDFRRELSNPKTWVSFIAPSLFISINWMTYIWAVNNDFVIETSLGYYMNPLILIFMGRIFYKEKLNTLQKWGLGFAFAGVILKTLLYGRLPLISLAIAISFSTYGFLKKKTKVDSLTGLAFETLIIGIPAIVYILYVEISARGISGNLPYYYWLLIMTSGIATATPLLLYAESLKRLPLKIMGFIQYISPSISLLLGIFAFNEPFDKWSLSAFALVWIGLGFFTYSQVLLLRNERRKPD